MGKPTQWKHRCKLCNMRKTDASEQPNVNILIATPNLIRTKDELLNTNSEEKRKSLIDIGQGVLLHLWCEVNDTIEKLIQNNKIELDKFYAMRDRDSRFIYSTLKHTPQVLEERERREMEVIRENIRRELTDIDRLECLEEYLAENEEGTPRIKAEASKNTLSTDYSSCTANHMYQSSFTMPYSMMIWREGFDHQYMAEEYQPQHIFSFDIVLIPVHKRNHRCMSIIHMTPSLWLIRKIEYSVA